MFTGHIHISGRGILPDVRFGNSIFYIGRIGGCKRVVVLPISFIKAAEGVFPQGAIRTGLQQDIVGTGYFMFFPGTVFDRVKDHVRILQVIRNF